MVGVCQRVWNVLVVRCDGWLVFVMLWKILVVNGGLWCMDAWFVYLACRLDDRWVDGGVHERR